MKTMYNTNRRHQNPIRKHESMTKPIDPQTSRKAGNKNDFILNNKVPGRGRRITNVNPCKPANPWKRDWGKWGEKISHIDWQHVRRIVRAERITKVSWDFQFGTGTRDSPLIHSPASRSTRSLIVLRTSVVATSVFSFFPVFSRRRTLSASRLIRSVRVHGLFNFSWALRLSAELSRDLDGTDLTTLDFNGGNCGPEDIR